jgi:hypothetical protein
MDGRAAQPETGANDPLLTWIQDCFRTAGTCDQRACTRCALSVVLDQLAAHEVGGLCTLVPELGDGYRS